MRWGRWLGLGGLGSATMAFVQGCTPGEGVLFALLLLFVGGADAPDLAWECGSDAATEICVSNFDGTGFRVLTDDNRNDEEPALSVDRSTIAFECDDGDDEICVMDADGSNFLQLTHNTTEDEDPAVSDDGRVIAYRCEDPGDGSPDVCLIHADGTGFSRLVTDIGNFPAPSLSGDGSVVAFDCLDPSFSNSPELCTIQADGSGFQQLTGIGSGADFPLVFVTDSVLAKGGSKIAFACGFVPDFDLELCVVNSDGTGLVRLTDNGTDDTDPSISAEGERIAYSCFDGEEVCVVKADGTGFKRLTDNATTDGDPAMSFDGTRVVYDCDPDDRGSDGEEICVVDSDGTGFLRLTDNDIDDDDGASAGADD